MQGNHPGSNTELQLSVELLIHCPVVTDTYIAAKMLIQLHLMSIGHLIGLYTISGHLAWTAVLPAAPNVTMDMKLAQCHCGHETSLDCSILLAAPTYST